jgi:hypothetical protein
MYSDLTFYDTKVQDLREISEADEYGPEILEWYLYVHVQYS